MTIGIIVAVPGIDVLTEPVPTAAVGIIGGIDPPLTIATEGVTAVLPVVVAPLAPVPAVGAIVAVPLAALASAVLVLLDDVTIRDDDIIIIYFTQKKSSAFAIGDKLFKIFQRSYLEK